MTQALRARWCVNAIFLLHGVIVANWLARIPAVQQKLGLSIGALGVYLLATTIGALFGMPLAAKLVGLYGSAGVLRVSTVLFCVCLLGPGIVAQAWMLAPALFAFGLAAAGMEVSMNTQAVLVERQLSRPVMTTFHAMFSIGGMVGAGMGGFAASHNLTPALHLALASPLLLIASAFSMRTLLPDPPKEVVKEPVHWTRHLGRLWAIGAIAFCVLVGEGAMADWTAVYLSGIPGVSAGLAAGGYSVFSICMAAGRFGGDWLRARFPEVNIIRYGATLAFFGITIGLITGGLVGALAGFGCAGFGFSSIFPILTSKSGQVRGIPAPVGIAAVTAFGYSGFLAGPPLIGFVSQATSLRVGLGLVPLLSVVAVALSGRLPEQEQVPEPVLTAKVSGLIH